MARVSRVVRLMCLTVLAIAVVACQNATPAPTNVPSAPSPGVAPGAGRVPSSAASAQAGAASSPSAVASASPTSPFPSVVSSPAVYTGPVDDITLIQNSLDTGNAAVYVGIDDGIFQEHGLNTTLDVVSNVQASLAALLSGQAQFAQIGGTSALSPAGNGADLTVLAVVIPVYSYLLESSPSITSPDQLRGKAMAVGGIGDSGYFATVVALKHVGLDPNKDVSILPTGGTPVRVAALLSGQVQAAVLSFPDNLALESQGFHRMLDLASLHLPAAGDAIMADKNWVSSHPSETQRYIDAWMESNMRVKHNKTAALASMAGHMKGYTNEELSATYDYYVSEVFPDVPTPDPGLFQDAITELGATDPTIANVDLATLLDPSFVQNAQARGLGM